MLFPKISFPAKTYDTISGEYDRKYSLTVSETMACAVLTCAEQANLITKDDVLKSALEPRTLNEQLIQSSKALSKEINTKTKGKSHFTLSLTKTKKKTRSENIEVDFDDSVGNTRFCYCLQLDSHLGINLSLNHLAPESLQRLSQSIAAKYALNYSSFTSFEGHENLEVEEHLEHLKEQATKQNLAINYGTYLTIVPENEILFDNEKEFNDFLCQHAWYENNSLEEMCPDKAIEALSQEDKKHPLYPKLLTILRMVNTQIELENNLLKESYIGYREETNSIFSGVLLFGGFMNEHNIIQEKYKNDMSIGEDMLLYFKPKTFEEVIKVKAFVNHLELLSEKCYELLSPFLIEIGE